MKKAQGNLVVAILFLLVAALNLFRVDFEHIEFSEIIIPALWLLGSLISFWEYRKNSKIEAEE